MNTIVAEEKSSFEAALSAADRAKEIPESEDLYGWLVGAWGLDVRVYWVDVASRNIKAEAHFAWVLEGRAVQDVWIIPSRANRTTLGDKNSYGTTLRVWDPTLQAWRVTWINPVTGMRAELIGRRSGNDIVQIGTFNGTPIRWIFTDITENSFRWIGETLQPDGKTWKLEGEYVAHRIH